MRGPKPFRIFLTIILVLTPLAQAFWFLQAWRLIAAVAWPAARALLQGLWIVAAFAVLASVFDQLGYRVLPLWVFGPWGRAGARLWLIASCLAFLAVSVVEGLAWLSQAAMAALPVTQQARIEPARRLLFRAAVWLAGSLPFLAAVYGTTAGRRWYRLVPVDVPLAHLPPSLEGLRIVHVSDLHSGPFMPRRAVRRAVDMINAVQPDLAVLTGDLISNAQDPLEDCIAELSRLRAPLGIWGCHGNHEQWSNLETKAQALFTRYGMHLLRQECVELSWHGERFNLIGVDDQREHARPGEPSTLLRGVKRLVRPDIPNILLSHNPNTFPQAAALGIELSLAGHTHGGQIRVAFGRRQWSPARFITPFVAGLYRLPFGPEEPPTGDRVPRPRPSACLYVNRGLGTYVLPLRLGVPPEITVLTLRAAG
jgi:predicted MPP superfamily phosphohydrolase